MTSPAGWDDEEPWEEAPPLDRLYETPDPDRTWAHPDGHLHADPPLPVARVSYREAGYQLPIFGGVGWWPAIEAPACGAVFDVTATVAADGQRRRYQCDRRVGHVDDDGKNPGQHRCVTWDPSPNGGGKVFIWDEATVAEFAEIERRLGGGA